MYALLGLLLATGWGICYLIQTHNSSRSRLNIAPRFEWGRTIRSRCLIELGARPAGHRFPTVNHPKTSFECSISSGGPTSVEVGGCGDDEARKPVTRI